MKRLERLFRWLNVAVIIATLLAYVSPYVNPQEMWLFSFFGTGYSWLLLANILFVLFWLFFKNRYFLFSLICILIGWNHLTTFIGINMFDTTKIEQPFTIASYNLGGLHRLSFKNKTKETKKRQEFFTFINDELVPNILCTQETAWSDLVTTKDFFKYKVRSREVAIFSKYPFIASGQIDFDTPSNAGAWADIQLPNQRIIRVYSVHFQSNRVSMDAAKLRKEGDLQEKETWVGIRKMLGKYKRTAAQRAAQAEIIAKHAAKSPYLAIICGDFNDTPQSYTYKLLADNRQDAYQEAAFGLGTTYSGSIPGLKIDFTLAHPKFKIKSHRILKHIDYSDHYPIVSEIGF